MTSAVLTDESGRRWRVLAVTHNEGHESEHPADECPGGEHWPCSSTPARDRLTN